MTEKRKRTRAQAGFEIKIYLGEESVTVRTINVSLTGLLCTSSPRFREGVPCRAVFHLNSGTVITVDGKIHRCDARQAVVVFTFMDETSFGHLKKLVSLNTGNADIIEQELAASAFVAP